MKVNDRVFIIQRGEFGIINAIKDRNHINKLPAKLYFVSIINGPGFWFQRNELTEGT